MNKSIQLIVVLVIASILYLGVTAITEPDCIREDHTLKEISIMVYEQGEDLRKCE